MKVLRILAFLLGGLVVLVGAGAIVIVATFDPNRFKSDITQLVKDKKQRTLRLEGDIALSFWPSVGVRLGRTTLSERNSEQQFAALDSAHVSLRIAPLVRKRIVIDKLDLVGVKASLVRRKDGSLNIDDLLSKNQEQDDAVRFDIAGVRVAKAELAWRDEKSGQSATLSQLDLVTGRIGTEAQGKLQLSGHIDGVKPSIKADLKLAGDYALAPERFSAKQVDVHLIGAAEEIKGLDLAIAAASVQLEPAAGALALERVDAIVKGRTAADSFELKLGAPKLQLAAGGAGGETVSAALKLEGSGRSIDAKLALAQFQGSTQALQVGKLGLDLDAKFAATVIRAALTSPLTADLKTRVFELSKLAGELTVANPLLPMKSVKLPIESALRADFARQTASANVATQFDESAVRSKWTVSRFSPLALGFDVDIDRLDLDRYFPPGPKSPAAAQPERPFDFSALKDLNAGGTVKIGTLRAANIRAANVRLELKAANGRLDLAPMAANLYNGSLSGSLALHADRNQLALKQTLSNVSINPLMRDALDKDLLEGRGSVALDLVTAGNTVSAMKRAMAGSASLSLRDGAIKGINLAKSLRQAKAAVNLRRDAVQRADQQEKTDFSEMTASLRIAGGIARNSDLQAKSPFLRLTGEGELSIPDSTMDYLAKATVVNSSAGQEGKELAELRGVTVPVRVSGPFGALRYELRFGDMLADAAKTKAQQAVDQKKQELQQKAQSQVQDRLKGMLGR